MEKSTIKFFAVSLVLFLSVPAVNSQWGFGLGKGDNWDLLWSNIGDLDKYDLNKNSNELANNVTPRQTSNPGGTSLRSRYGRFVQSADSSDESDDSSSEEISVGIGETIYNTYLGNKQNDNYDNRLERQPTAGEYNTEGEEYVYNREAGTGSETETDNNGQNGGNSQRQSGSWKSPWTETGSNREGGFTKQNNQDMNYEKRSPHNQRGQQGQIGQGVDQGQRGNTRGQGQSGQQRYHSWADYQRQQQRRNMGEEFEPEDVTPASNGGQGQGQGHGRGNGQLGENEAEGNMRQSGAQATVTTGNEFEWIEPEDRTTPASVSNKKTTTAGQEYEAEDVTTQAPGGSATSGRVTVRGSTTEEYEFEGTKTTTTAPKKRKQSDTWESGMATNPNKPGQTGQGGKTPDGNFRGRWVDIGERPQQQNVNSTDKNGWAMYAGSLEGSGPEKGAQTKQPWVDLNPNEKQPATNQGHTKPGSASVPVQNGHTFPGSRSRPSQHGSIDTGMPSDSKPNSIPSGNMKTSPWLDTSPHMLTRQPKPSFGNGQQPNKTPLVRPEFQRDRSPVHARPSDSAVRQPALRDPAIRYPNVRVPAGRDPAWRDPAIRYPDARNTAGRDPAIRYPDASDTAGRDPAIRYPDARDPAGRDPVGRDPTGRDPAIRYPDVHDPTGRDPAIRYPDARDPAGRDPTVHSPGGRDPARHDPALVRPNRFNPMARPERPSRHRSPPAQPSVPSPTPIRSSTQPRWRQQPVRQSPPRGPKPDQTARTNISPNNVREPSPEGWIDPPAMDKQAPRQPSRETNTNWNALNDGQRNVPRPQWNQFQQPRQHNRVVKKPENNVHRSGQQTGPATIHKVVRPAQPNRRVVPGPSNFNNVARPQQQDWRANSGSPKVNNVGSKVPTQFPAGNSKILPSVVGQGRPLMRPDSTSGPAGKNTDNSNNLPIKKPTHSIPFKERQPVFKDINIALSSRSGDNSGNPPADWHTDTQPQAVVDHVTEKPVVDGTKVSKKPMMPDTSHVTVAMKLDVSDASVQSLKTNDWGNDLHRGDFVYKPKPTKVPRGHKSKGSVQNKWVNNPDTPRVNQEKPKRGRIETSTFSVIRPNSQTAHTGPAIIRPTKQNSHPWSNNNNIEAAGEGSNMHMKNIKNLIDQQRPSSVIKHFIEMTTENGLDASGSQGNKGLITNIDQTLSSDNPRVINLLRDIERANQQPVQGQQEKGVPRNDVIAKMSSTGVLGQHPNTIDMAPGHGSIVDGVNAEVLLNSNANLHGVINSKDSKRYRPANGNSVLHSSKLENTKNRAPYPGFRTSGTANDIHFGEISLKVKSVNAEARPVEEAEVGGPGKVNVVPGSNNSVKNSQQTQKDVSNGQYSNNGNNIDQNVGRTNVNKATINTGNKRVKTDTKNVQSSIDSSSASTINPVVHTESSAKSEFNTNPSQKESNTKPSTQSKSSSTAGSQTRVAQQTVSGTIGQQTARGARIQHQAQRRIQRPTQGGFGTPWRGGVDGGGVWKAAARNEARELVLEKEGHWNSLSHGIKDRKTTHFSNRRRLV